MNRRAGLALGWAWVAAVVYLSLAPGLPNINAGGGDKLGHFAAYGALAYWFCQFYAGRTRLLYLAGFVALGISLEFAQGATGYRTFDLADMAANTVGVVLGWIAARFLPLRVSKA